MNNFLDLANARRSTRVFDGRGIKREDLELCAEAARLAPSACNSQPWKFIIIDDPHAKEAVIKDTLSGIYKMNSFSKDAGAFIAIISEKMKFPAWMGGKVRNTDFRRIDIGIACAHLVLQARELNIKTCILGWFNEGRLKKILSIPFWKKIELVIAMGYNDSEECPERRLKDKSEVVGFNKY
ncbi:MAG: nitroreductase family protein [Candidatus Omnitrophica bacterium]|nr:nitroreductase family protein [Candidatus Omnitrophota bacterium]